MVEYPTAPFVYDFSLSYYENFKASRLKALSTGGTSSLVFGVDRADPDNENPVGVADHTKLLWYDYPEVQNGENVGWEGATKATIINSDGVSVEIDNGIDVKEYINNVYNGDQPTCLIDKLVREIGNVLSKIEIGGCKIHQAIYDVIDSITDVFGTFICTATLESVDCGGPRLLDELKAYRDSEVITTAEGLRIVKYYEILGPKIVEAIDLDPYKDIVYKYIMAEYVTALESAIHQEKGSGQRAKVFSIYFQLMDDMVDRYDIKVSSTFKKWSKEYHNG